MSTAHKSAKARAEIGPAPPDRFLTAKILEAQDNERRKISRELHDSVGGSLAVIKIDLAKIRPRLAKEDLKALEQIEQRVDALMAEIRTVSHLLHPPMLDLLGLRSSILWYAKEFQRRTQIQTSVNVPESLPKFEPAGETALFRIIQECLTNIHKHAKASNVAIKVSIDETFQLEITDDGVGFADGFCEGVGLRGMRERLNELGGTLRVESGVHAGTSVVAKIPLKSR